MLLLVDDTRFSLSEETAYAQVPMNRLFEEMANSFNGISLFSPTKHPTQNINPSGTILNQDLVRLIPGPYFSSPMDFLKNPIRNYLAANSALRAEVPKHDIVFIRLPTLVGIVAFFHAIRNKKYLVFQVKGEWGPSVRTGNLWGIKKIAASMVVGFFDALSRIMIRRGPVMVHGQQAYEKYSRIQPDCHKIQVSILDEAVVENTGVSSTKPGSFQKRLLFVGRLSEAKGLYPMLRSMQVLKDHGFTLTVVGDGELYEPAMAYSRENGLSECVDFVGGLPFGDDLFDIYRRSDIFLLPSYSEGIPKVLFEAMAFGLPIVASDVGGIPDVINESNGGILIEPGSHKDIVDAVLALSEDEQRRSEIIRSQSQYVPQVTLQASAQRISQIILSSFNNSAKQ